MAITAIEYALISDRKQAGILPLRPHIMELGEANWYGDVPLQQLYSDIDRYVQDDRRREELTAEFQRVAQTRTQSTPFHIAKVFYEVFFDYESITAIDFHGTEAALRLNLNTPIQLDRQFDFVINDGTAEHIFNVFQFFQTMHELTNPGGIMFHGVPFTGWVDHGFFNFNPTFFFDLVRHNRYRLLALFYAEMRPLKIHQIERREQIAEMANTGQLGDNSLLYAILRKGAEQSPFEVPIQGYYAGTVSDEVRQSWRQLR